MKNMGTLRESEDYEKMNNSTILETMWEQKESDDDIMSCADSEEVHEIDFYLSEIKSNMHDY